MSLVQIVMRLNVCRWLLLMYPVSPLSSMLLPGSDVSGVTEGFVKLLHEMHGCDVDVGWV